MWKVVIIIEMEQSVKGWASLICRTLASLIKYRKFVCSNTLPWESSNYIIPSCSQGRESGLLRVIPHPRFITIF